MHNEDDIAALRANSMTAGIVDEFGKYFCIRQVCIRAFRVFGVLVREECVSEFVFCALLDEFYAVFHAIFILIYAFI